MSNDYDPRFAAAVARVLAHEGGFVDDPVDPGGATNWGISLRFLAKAGAVDADDDGWLDGDLDRDGDIDADDIRAMSRDEAVAIYHAQWWERYRYGLLVLGIAAKTFDLAVNMGAGQAHRLLQRAVWAAEGRMTIADDGVLGPHTRDSLARFGNRPELILGPLRSEAAGFYRALIARKPELGKYRRGWLRRAYD